ncbi:ATP-binding protein [Actinoallomurus spadix]|uniref:Histidine kinase/HSP90-like ATPase domain-containing protein n=1 Tax=Actinoallomurus spadix TaxID=79912 RepID=A0ABN0WWQ0_9ACTN|nr:ATP-binding protein [Actinoallomurus spadix]MCO5986684.1 ATP-binding protein [Actinoallomurus spadix]
MSSVVFLPHAPSSVSDVRKRLCAELCASGVYEEVADDAAVIISELISNALRHARPLPSGDIRVSWAYEGELIQLAVSDGGSMTEPRRTRAALSSLGGRGLSIVEALSEKWGVSHESETTTVWARIRATQPSSNGQAISLIEPMRIAFDHSL